MDDQHPIFTYIRQYVPLTEAEAEFFRTKVTARHVRKGEFLLAEGEVNSHQNFVVRGCLKTYRLDGDGTESILTFSVENWWSGDLYSFLTGSPSPYFIEALEPTDVIRITRPDLDAVYEQIPQINTLFRILLERAFIAQQERIMGNIAATATERYLTLRKTYPDFEHRIPQHQLARYLGITPQFLSMIRKKLSLLPGSSSS